MPDAAPRAIHISRRLDESVPKPHITQPPAGYLTFRLHYHTPYLLKLTLGATCESLRARTFLFDGNELDECRHLKCHHEVESQ